MPVVVVRENIISLHPDAVVNPATPSLTADEGVSAEIFAAAGQRKLSAACKQIGYCETGCSVITKGYDLPAKFVIHTVGPIWRRREADQMLSAAYRSALELAAEAGCGSVAMPLLSVGRYGCPSEVSLEIALREIHGFLEHHEMKILLVLPKKFGPILKEERLRAVQNYVDANFRSKAEAPVIPMGHPSQTTLLEETCAFPTLAQAAVPVEKRSLAAVLQNLDESFNRMLLRLIDEKGYTDAEVYKQANLT